jgi:hypothetical protein
MMMSLVLASLACETQDIADGCLVECSLKKGHAWLAVLVAYLSTAITPQHQPTNYACMGSPTLESSTLRFTQHYLDTASFA